MLHTGENVNFLHLKTVMVVELGTLLSEIVNSFLGKEPDVRTVRVSPHNIEELIDAACQYKPWAIIMDDSLTAETTFKPFLFFREVPVHRILVVNSQTNTVQVYQNERVSLLTSEDFVQAVIG